MKSSKSLISIVILLTITLGASWGGYSALLNYQERVKLEKEKEALTVVKESITRDVFSSGKEWPEEINISEGILKLEYTFDEKLMTFIKKLLKRHRSDYSSVVVIDNDTGNILAAVGYQKDENQFNSSLPFSSTHPSASLFKIVTSADLLENSEVEKETVFKFRGRGTTLYKYQLEDRVNRWTRHQSFRKAFAYSNNVVFGKAAIKNTTGESIFSMASNFGFNQKLMEEVSVGESSFNMPSSQYNLAELASGFNKKTLISPLHGAVITSVVANNGVYKSPKLIKNIKSSKDDELIWKNEISAKKVLAETTANDLQDMMELTVKSGTARGSFRRLKIWLRENVKIGGKTGSITGGVPYGKRDWFAAFASPRDNNAGKGISICVMNINVNKWYVKSTFLAKSIIEYYYENISPLNGDSSSQVAQN